MAGRPVTRRRSLGLPLLLLISKTLQVIRYLLASRDKQIEQGLLDVQAESAGQKDAVRGAVYEDGFVGLLAFSFLGAEDDAEGVGEEDGGVGWRGC